MKLKEIITAYKERGGYITEELIYNKYGSCPVYSASSLGTIGYYNKHNYITTPYTFIYTLNGIAGSVLITHEKEKIWFSNDTGVIEIDPNIAKQYKKETIAIYLQYLFICNRHNNGGRPKFSIKRCLEVVIDMEVLDFIENHENKEVGVELELKKNIVKILGQTDLWDNKSTIKLEDLIESYKERGKRLTYGKDIYLSCGKIKIISADIYKPMGYYNSANYIIKENSFIYTIDGNNAGSILLINPENIWLTDHAGVINIKKQYVDEYGRLAIAIYLDAIFKANRDGTGARPQFLLKKVLKLNLNLCHIRMLTEMRLERLFSL